MPVTLVKVKESLFFKLLLKEFQNKDLYENSFYCFYDLCNLIVSI